MVIAANPYFHSLCDELLDALNVLDVNRDGDRFTSMKLCNFTGYRGDG